MPVCAVLMVPLPVWQYHRLGRLSPRRIAAACAVSVYAVALLAYTLLPLPDSTTRCGRPGVVHLQLVRFRFVADVVAANRGRDLAATPSSQAALQVVSNVALFVPLGLVVRTYWRRGVLVTTLVGLGCRC